MLGKRSAGFTLLEVMVVISIILLLFGLVLFSATSYRKRAAENACKALILRLQDGLETYKSRTGQYPPDGLDTDVTNDQGERIVGSACLYYFLSREIATTMDFGGELRPKRYPPAMDFNDSELSPEDPDYPGVREVLDGFGVPVHYDNTQNGQFQPQDGDVHVPPESDHPVDPRESAEFGAVESGREGIQTPNGYDLWSHGRGTHLEVEDLSGTIANWNMQTGG